MSNKLISEFQVVVYSTLEKYNETISKARCRIFYKGGNRNGTYITDEFAEKLISTLPYTPVKGIYLEDEGDYTDHGMANSEGRIYGIVPENPNLRWEEHEDIDGIKRLYACVDVLIFTGLYTEANSIVGKSQSMELYAPSIKGQWKILNGKKYFVYTDACFFGLQVLGNNVEPCFEGAAFFTLVKDMEKAIKQIESYSLNLDIGGSQEMKINFKLSDDDKYSAIWSLLNARFNEENDWIVDYSICSVYDDYAVVKNFAEGIYERVYYTKNDKEDSLEITKKERCFIIDVNESEKNSLDNIYSLNENTYVDFDTKFTTNKNDLEKLQSDYSKLKNDFDTKIGEYETTISTLTTEKDNAVTSLNEANISLNTLTEENASLKAFKLNAEKEEKMEVINKFSNVLDADTINEYINNIDNFTCKDLSKELSYVLVTKNQSVFTSQKPFELIIKDNEDSNGISKILSKYQKQK